MPQSFAEDAQIGTLAMYKLELALMKSADVKVTYDIQEFAGTNHIKILDGDHFGLQVTTEAIENVEYVLDGNSFAESKYVILNEHPLNKPEKFNGEKLLVTYYIKDYSELKDKLWTTQFSFPYDVIINLPEYNNWAFLNSNAIKITDVEKINCIGCNLMVEYFHDENLHMKTETVSLNDKEDFEKYLQTINRQIKDIEHLVNEFSDFARMPKPVFKKTDFKEVINRAINLHSLSNQNINFNFIHEKENITIEADEEQLNRAFVNLIKNSVESIIDKSKKNGEFVKKIDIEIKEKNNYIYCTIDDNGEGFSDKNLNNIVKPYFTTKQSGTGLGLAIVNKIVNDHDGKIYFKSKQDGASVEIVLPKNVS